MTVSLKHLSIGLLMLGSLLSACNYPGRATPAPSGPSMLYTAAAQTLQAQLTQVSQSPATQAIPTFAFPTQQPTQPLPTFALPTSVIPTSLPASTQQPSATPVPCDRGEFIKDITYPDDSLVAPGEVFVKTWRLRNGGSCAWSTGYALVFSGGEAMGAPAAIPLAANVPPGNTVDLSVTLTAPLDGGTYRGEFKLRNASNVLFGLGSANKAFWVQVKVPVKTGLLYDFLVNADTATYTSNSGTEAPVALVFGGDDNNPAGVAKIKDGVKLENGATSGKILLMFPKRADNGLVTGVFSAHAVQAGDHFKARLGFMLPEGASGCGSGKVKFQLLYKDGDVLKVLKEWSKSCNGSLLPVDVDLSSLKGKNVSFGLLVFADGPPTDDWAIWNSPRIDHP